MVNTTSSSFAEAAAAAFNNTVDTLVQRQQGQAQTQTQEQNPMAAMLAGVKLNLSGVSVASENAGNNVPNNADKGPAIGV